MKFRYWAALAMIAISTTVRADEPVAQFRKALVKAGFHDMVEQYLDSLKSKKGLSAEFMKSIPFERAVALIRSSRTMQDVKQKRSTLSQAERLLADFVKANPGHAKKNEAIFEQASATRERGKVDMDLALFSKDGKRKKRLMASSRPLFLAANKLFLSAKTLLQAELKTFPASIDRKKKPKKYEARETVRRKFHDAMYFEAVTLFDLARTFDEKNSKFKPNMKKAADSFKNIAQLQRMTPNGFRSKFMQGRCYQKMKLFRQALPVYKELIELNGKSNFVNKIRNQAKYYQLMIWNDDSQKEYKLAEVAAGKWLNAPENRDEVRTRIGLKIRFQRAIAYEKHSQQKKTQDREKIRLLQQAQDDAQIVSREPNLHQTEAVLMVARIKQKRGIASSDPNSFADAYAQAKTQFQIVNEKISDLKIAQFSKKTSAEMQKLESELNKSLQDAVHLLELAVKLSSKETDPKQFNDVRYRLSFLYFYQKRYYEAAVLAEGVSLAMKRTTPLKAPDAAFIALSAYIKLYNSVPPNRRAFETEQVKKTANLFLTNWPNSERAGEAVAQLAQIHEISGELMEANGWFAKIPKSSPKFGTSQIRIGKNLLFFLYRLDNFNQNRTALSAHLLKIRGQVLVDILVGLKAISANEVAKKKPEELLQVLKAKLKRTSDKDLPAFTRTIQKLGLKVAENYFENGMKATTKNLIAADAAPPELLDAKTALAQLKLAQNQFAEAIKLLTQEPHSPLKAIEVPDESKRPDDNSVKGRRYAQSVYQLLIQAYISSEETDKATRMLNKLEKLFESSDQSKLTQMFEGIARSLQEDIERLKKQGDVNLLNNRVRTLERFLEGLYQKRGTLSYSSLLWIATTFSGLGEGMGNAGAKYYARAAETYAELLKQPNLDADRILAVKLRLIDCRRLQKDFKSATRDVSKILKARPNLLIAQLSSPKIYEDWGKSGNADAFLTAINGDKKNGIWGWAKVSDRLQRKMRSENTSPEKSREYFEKFYDARYRIGWCRMEFGKALSTDVNNPQRRAVLSNAKTEIDSLALISGKLNPTIKSRFDELYRQIQLAMGKPNASLEPIGWSSSILTQVKNTPQNKVKKQKVVAETKTESPDITTTTSSNESTEGGSLSTFVVVAIFVAGGGLAFWFVFSLQRQEKKRRKMYLSTSSADKKPFDFQSVTSTGTKTAVRRRKSKKISASVTQKRGESSNRATGRETPVRKKPKSTGRG